MKLFKGFSRAEWRVINVSLVLMMLCAFALSNERVMSLLGGSHPRREQIAELLEAKGDVRVKFEASKVWADPEKSLLLGDVVWVNEGAAVHVRLRPGVEFRAAGRALFRLPLLEGVPSVDMISGRFDWLIDGEQSVGVRGTRGRLAGRQLGITVELAQDTPEPQVRVTSGQGGLEAGRPRSGPEAEDAPVPALTANNLFHYVFRLNDFYQIENQRLILRRELPRDVPVEVPLNWEHPVVSGPFRIQLAGTEDFSSDRRFLSSGEPGLVLETALLGDNYWRVTYNGLAWSDARMFRVEGRFLDVTLKPERREVLIRLRETRQALVKWRPSEPMAGFVAEISSDAAFAPEKTDTLWLTVPETAIEAELPGSRFVRVRAFNDRQELGDWSPAVKVSASD